jgi:glycosyltransferase involved in cell wall biosynthesis
MGIYVLRLLPALAVISERPEIRVALARCAGPDPWPGLKGIERVWGSGKNTILWEQRELPRLAVRSQASLLHCTANASPWKSEVPHVVTVHDAIFIRKLTQISGAVYPRQLLAHYYYYYGVARGAGRAKLVLTDSEYSRLELIKKLRLKPGNIRVIPLGVPHQLASLHESEVGKILGELKIPRPYVLGFGAIDLRKNTANLVRAFAQLPPRAAATLVLAGLEMARRSRIPKLVNNLGLKDRVRTLNYVTEKELMALYQGAAVLAYPTRAEGFGLPVLQAFYLGVPVVTSEAGSIPELAGKAVCYADPENPYSIARALLSVLIDPPKAHALAMAGRLRSEGFTWETTARKTLGAYQEALSAR